MNPVSDALPVNDAAPDPQTPAGAAQAADSDAFAALLAAAAALGPPPTPGQAEAARTAPAEGTEAGSDSPGPNDSIGVTIATQSGSQTSQAYRPATGALGEEIDGATPEATDAADPAPAPADAPAADPEVPAVAEPRTPDGENPSAIAYAQRRLQQLVRAGVIERVPDGDPTAAWRELSKDIRAIAERAGYTDPREFLARGHVAQQPASTQAPAQPKEAADVPISFSSLSGAASASSQVSSETPVTRTGGDAKAPAAHVAEVASEDASRTPASVRHASAGPRAHAPIESETGGGSRRPAASSPTPATGVEAAAMRGATPTPGGEPGAPRPVTARLHELVAKTETTIRVAVRNGHTDARITLRPPELGEVRITLRYEGGGVSALLTADSGKAVEMLAQASADLRRSLEQQGLTVQGLDVRLAGEDARQGAAPWRDGAHLAPPRVGPNRETDDNDQQPQGTEPAARVPEAGRIDVLA